MVRIHPVPRVFKKRVSYSGYYVTLPRSRYGFDSRYPLSQRKKDWSCIDPFFFCLDWEREENRKWLRKMGVFQLRRTASQRALRTEGFSKSPEFIEGRVRFSVPQNYAMATNAVYTVSSNGNSNMPFMVDQSAYSSAWVDIGTYQLHKTGNLNVVLTRNTGESGKIVAADAVRFQFIAP